MREKSEREESERVRAKSVAPIIIGRKVAEKIVTPTIWKFEGCVEDTLFWE